MLWRERVTTEYSYDSATPHRGSPNGNLQKKDTHDPAKPSPKGRTFQVQHKNPRVTGGFALGKGAPNEVPSSKATLQDPTASSRFVELSGKWVLNVSLHQLPFSYSGGNPGAPLDR